MAACLAAIHYKTWESKPCLPAHAEQDGISAFVVLVQTLISAAIAKPKAPLSGLALLDEQSKTQIMEAFNATETAFPDKATLHSLFEKQAALHPSRTCIVGADHVYTYRQVQEHANQVCALPWLWG